MVSHVWRFYRRFTVKTSPITDADVATRDQTKRWSNALNTAIAKSPRNTPMMMIFWTVRVSARGPARMRRCRAAGFVRAK